MRCGKKRLKVRLRRWAGTIHVPVAAGKSLSIVVEHIKPDANPERERPLNICQPNRAVGRRHGMDPVTQTFFVPVKALSKMFRAILVRRLEEQIRDSRLKLPEGFAGLESLRKELYQKNWNVYSKKAFGGISSVLSYLGRYTHRVAISNNRLTGMEEGKVTFSYRDYQKDNRYRSMTLEVEEFARRFLQHILPCGFYKIRYLGILATAHVHTKREQSISLVGKTLYLAVLEGLTAYEVLRVLTGKDPARCPECKTGFMIRDKNLAGPG